MPLETNLNTPPYYDDFDANNNFYRVLFRPSTAVQARELTQLQSILQDQVEKFGKHIFVEGSIIDGCGITFDDRLDYIKILDNYSNGTAISSVADFIGKKVYSSNTLLEAIIVNAVEGFEAANPDLNTLYIKYINSGTYANNSPQKKYDPNQIVQIRTVANTLFGTVTVGNSSVNSVGVGYTVSVTEGTIFQKGFFVRVEPQTTIVTKYNNQPDKLSVGFKTNESIITSDSDEDLLDNALGSPNYNAPGANRLKLSANLVVRATDNTSITANTANTDNFFSIVDFEGGRAAVIRTDPEYAKLGRQLAKRTYEESGNYIIDPFELAVTANTSNSTYHVLSVDKGLGYPLGYRVEFADKRNLNLRKGTDTSSIDNLVVGTGYGNYILVKEFVGVFDTDSIVQVNLCNATATAITSGTYSSTTLPANTLGTAYVHSVVYDSGTPGTANAQYRMYLNNIRMANGYNFDSVRSVTVQHASANGIADVILTNGNAYLYDSSLKPLLFPIGRRAIANTSDRSYTARQVKSSVTFTSGVATITPDGSNTTFSDTGSPLSTTQEDRFIIIPISNTGAPGINKGQPISLKSTGNIVATSVSANIDVGIANTFTADVFYNVSRSIAPTKKTVNKNIMVGIQANTHPNTVTGPWSLGLPDVYKLRAVYQGSTYSNTNTNNVRYFELDNGQRDSFYNHSQIKIKPGSGHTIGANDRLLVEFDCFRADISTGSGYFTVDSYVIDDSASPAANTINTAEIPVYLSLSGNRYDLRDMVDYRPQYVNTAAYAITNGTITVNPSTTNTFNTTSVIVPAPDTTASFDVNFYIGRTDKVVLSPDSRVAIIEGIPSLTPTTPKDQEGAMTLGIVNIPPYPSLTQEQSRTYNRFDYFISTSLLQQRRYTMRDVGIIDQRVKNLEYYTLLSTLEADTEKLLITDSAGNDRFKNGIFVDSFKDFKIANTASAEYKAALDTQLGILRPQFESAYIPLAEKTLTNTTKYGKNLSLTYTHTPFITQPFASKVRNCAESLVYVFKGEISLSPDGDHAADVKRNPDIVLDVDLASPLLSLANAGFFKTSFGDWRTVSTSNTSTTSTGGQGAGALGAEITTTITTANQVRDVITASIDVNKQNYSYGDVVQDVSTQPYLRARRVTFTGTGLKPSTIVYPFFDDVLVSSYCKSSNSSLADVGAFNSTLTTDSIGTVYGVFYIPENTFKSGERTFKLVDIQNYAAEANTISTVASATYTGSNISITKANLGLSSAKPTISTSVTREQQRVITGVNVGLTLTVTQFGTDDPIAQSFLVSEPDGIPGIFISKIDLFFRQKHPSLGIVVEVREMDVDTGYPTPKILPYGSVVIPTANINTSADASLVTTVTFDSPIYLENGREYCFVVKPQGNNTDTKIWIAEIGGTDVTTQSPIYQNNPMGDIFISSTNRTWTAFTKEDIKCVIYRADFSSLTGSVNYKNSNTEYLTVNSFKSTFLDGETVYVSNAVVTVASGAVVNASLSNSIVIGTTTAQSAFSIGQMVYISSNSGGITDVATITALPNTTNIRLDANVSFTDNDASIGKLAGNGAFTGIIEFYNTDTGDLYIENSTANSSVNFNTGNTQTLIIGKASRARANLVSVDNVTYSVIVPQMSIIRPPGTTVNLTFNGTPLSTYVRETTGTAAQNDTEIELVDIERRVLSRSNELTYMTGNNSLQLDLSFTSANSRISPVINDIKKSVLVIKNNISSGNTEIANNETYPGGNTVVTSKYVSRNVILADGQDAEDIEVFLTASKPSGTEIYVYAKLQGSEDSEPFDEKYWSLLEQVNPTSTISSKVDIKSYNEYRYQLSLANNATISASKTAARNANNSNIVRYYTAAGAPVDTFKVFAIKIVMTSTEGTHLIPRIADMRAIALQA